MAEVRMLAYLALVEQQTNSIVHPDFPEPVRDETCCVSFVEGIVPVKRRLMMMEQS
jgi:hypothetical protein